MFANLSFKDGVLTGSASTASSATDIETLGNRVERVILVGLKIRPSTIISSVKAQLTFQVARLSNGLYTVEIKDPKVWIGKAWSVTLS